MTAPEGFPLLRPDDHRLHDWVIPGTGKTLRIRYGSAGFLLIHAALWYHEKIEPINVGRLDDWGHSYRQIDGSNEWSRHAYGLAIDLNALKHPQGRFTMRAWQVVKIRARLLFYAGCIRWGGEFHTTRDDMHWEINRSLTACERVARQLMKSPRGKRILAANPHQREVILS